MKSTKQEGQFNLKKQPAGWKGQPLAEGVKQFPVVDRRETTPDTGPKPVFFPPGRSTTSTPRRCDCLEQQEIPGWLGLLLKGLWLFLTCR